MNPASQYLIRPARLEDLDQLESLIASLSDSITTIPKDKAFLEKRIHKSIRAFYPEVHQAGDEQYLFVLEGPEGIVGTSGIIARVGGFQAFYTYEISNESLSHPQLDIQADHPTLNLKVSHDGPTEIGSLFLAPNARHSGLGRLLSLARFLFIARFPSRFRPQILGELRGFLDENGRSPFWEHVAKPFFKTEFNEADFLSGLGNKDFIKDLMPRHPLYIQLLPESVQAVIGKTHRDTIPAKAILEKEGFEAINEVDIFDAGPILQATTSKVRSVAQTKPFKIRSLATDSDISGPPWHAANGKLDFRACIAMADTKDDSCVLSTSAANSLDLQTGDTVWLSPARPSLPTVSNA